MPWGHERTPGNLFQPFGGDERPAFDVSWKNGLFVESADRAFALHLGGTLHYDAAWYSASSILELGPGGTGKFNDGFNPRRMRILAEGTIYDRIDFMVEYEFANGIGFAPAGAVNQTFTGSITNSPGPTQAWITVKDVPGVGNVRIGNQKEWFSLEHLNSHKFLEFMERSYLFDFSQPTAFNNGFSPGISVFNTWADDLVFTGIGFYKNMSNLLGFGVGDGNYAVTGRLAMLPVWLPDECIFWHLGGSFSHRDPVNGTVQLRVFDPIRNAPFPLLNLLANTGLLNAQSQDLFNIESAAVWGPLTLQAEYTANVIRGASAANFPFGPSGPPQGNLLFQGYYAEALVFLTGESREWDQCNFVFKRVNPRRPVRFRGDSGYGAWELGVRYSFLDLSHKAIRAGYLEGVTVGLNWYMNANAKMQFNYDYTHRGNTNTPAQGHVHGFGLRTALDF